MEGNDVEEWLEDMFAKVGGMWSDLRQAEMVNYVESRVHTIGTDVKSFCSEFMQEVFSSSPAQATTDPVIDIPLVQITQTEPRISSKEGVSSEMPSAEIPGNTFEEKETSGNVDEVDVIIPASSEYLSCQSTLTECLGGEDDLISPSCQLETSFSESLSENKECLDTLNHYAVGDCENEECLDAQNHLTASSVELLQVSAGNSVLTDWDYMHETMLGERCIVIHSSDPCPDKQQSTKQRVDDRKNTQRKPSLKVEATKDLLDSPSEPKTDDSRGGGHSTWPLEMVTPLAPEFELVEHDWEII